MAVQRRFVPILALAVAALAVAGCGAPSSPPPPRPVVILYGDSLSWEARAAFDFSMGGGVAVVHRNFPGLAPCDLLPSMAADAALLQPRAVVLEFAGNSLTPCMSGVTQSTLVGKYAVDVARAATTFTSRGIAVYLMGAPLLPGWSFDPTTGLRATYTAVAAQSPLASFTDAGASVLDRGAYTATLPCRPGEGPAAGCAGGLITVRSPDRVHFCPVLTTGPCPVWSSGAWRFGAAMAAPVRLGLGL
jgi:hypothetical protein